MTTKTINAVKDDDVDDNDKGTRNNVCMLTIISLSFVTDDGGKGRNQRVLWSPWMAFHKSPTARTTSGPFTTGTHAILPRTLNPNCRLQCPLMARWIGLVAARACDSYSLVRIIVCDDYFQEIPIVRVWRASGRDRLRWLSGASCHCEQAFQPLYSTALCETLLWRVKEGESLWVFESSYLHHVVRVLWVLNTTSSENFEWLLQVWHIFLI